MRFVRIHLQTNRMQINGKRKRVLTVAHKIAEVFADGVAMAEVVRVSRQAVEHAPVVRPLTGRKSRTAPRIGTGTPEATGTPRFRKPFDDGLRRGGKRIWPARSSFSSRVRAAISLSRPWALRQCHRRHSS
jgi:hypothetical protein